MIKQFYISTILLLLSSHWAIADDTKFAYWTSNSPYPKDMYCNINGESEGSANDIKIKDVETMVGN